MQQIFTLALENGLWAALFCLLFLYQIKDSRSREKKYTGTIDSLTATVRNMKNIEEATQNLQKDCTIIKSDCAEIKAAVKAKSNKQKGEGSYEL